MDYLQTLYHTGKLAECLEDNNPQLALDNFKKIWHDIEDAPSLFTKDNFYNRVISYNINTVNNSLIHNFLMQEARKIFKSNYDDFRNKTNTSIFNGAISLNNVDNIRKFLPQSINCEECLQMSIKYGSRDAFTYFLEEHIPQKQHKKIIAWAHREFWAYHHNNYGSSSFIKYLINHPLSQNKPLKQDIYTMLDHYEFSFIHELIQDNDTFPLFKDINVAHYYKLLIKNIISKKDEIYYEEGIQLLITSKQLINFDFSQIKLPKKIEKEHPDISQLIEKFILKDKLDSLPMKIETKKYKI